MVDDIYRLQNEKFLSKNFEFTFEVSKNHVLKCHLLSLTKMPRLLVPFEQIRIHLFDQLFVYIFDKKNQLFVDIFAN